MLAMALEVQGDLAGAAEALAEASGERDRINHFSGPSWLRVLQRLALTCRSRGNRSWLKLWKLNSWNS